MDLTNKICVVTGASSGIGRRTALDLAGLGARVCVAARRKERLVSLVEEMSGDGAGHSLCVTDVSRRDQAARLAGHVRSVHGRCDVLINNAGFARDRGFDRKGGVEDLEAVMATNFYGAAYCTAELLPLLKASAPSSVVNIASMAGRLAMGGASSYCASKFALVGWSEALNFELKPGGVHVGLVEPGPLPTEGFPQTALIDDRLMRFALTSDEEVSKAIIGSIRDRKLQRVIPRWYYLLQVPRLVAPPLYRFAQEKLLGLARR